MEINKETAEILLAKRLDEFGDAISKVVKVPLSQNQFDALVSFVYNFGAGKFVTSTLLQRLNEGRFLEAVGELLKWTNATVKGEFVELPGLVIRRAREARLFCS